MTSDDYERDFQDGISLIRNGKIDLNLFQNIDNAGDGKPGLQKAIRNWVKRWLHDGVMDQDIDMNNHNIVDIRSIDGGGDAIAVSDDINMNSNSITNLAEPTNDQDAATKNYIDEILGIGSANKRWINIPYYGGSNPGVDYTIYQHSEYVTLANSASSYGVWTNILPHTKGSLKLYITKVKIGIVDADAGDKIINFWVHGWSDHWNYTEIETDGTDYDAPQEVIYDIADIDCSSWEAIYFTIQIAQNASGDFGLSYFQIEYYYA